VREDEERFDFHIRVGLETADLLDTLIREFRPHVVRAGPGLHPEAAAYTLDALVPSDLRDRLEKAGYRVEVIARINQPNDLKRQVSQTDRFAGDLERLRNRPR
jgi:hypothetical protein